MQLRPHYEPRSAHTTQDEYGETVYVITDALSPLEIAQALRHRILLQKAGNLYEATGRAVRSHMVDMELAGATAVPQQLVDVLL